MKKPVLVIMAAGMGSRYGGLKQIDPIDDQGHIIMDFSIFDAKRAGFEKVVFIIKKELENDFKEVIGNRLANVMEVEYVFQELTNLPEGFEVPDGRIKPWGTAHAVLSCIDVVDGPFAVINADDYYGRDAFQKIYHFLSTQKEEDTYRFAMVGYHLKNTLTENGHVARGICTVDKNGCLVEVTERTRIEKRGEQAAFTEDDGASWTELPMDSIVSMNMWGFSEGFLQEIKAGFSDFLKEGLKNNPLKCEYFLPTVVSNLLKEHRATVSVLTSNDKIKAGFSDFLKEGLKNNPLKCEYFLPTVVSNLLKEHRATVSVLTSNDKWYGVTYKEDKQVVVNAMQAMKDAGIYPEKIWCGETEALLNFQLDGTAMSAVRYGSGHINDTFLVSLKKDISMILF